ncbi:MAG: MFS transporter [Inquilinus limosus]|uniref:MFS transporter n=1 Tax=Inquilinus limosus TaxID=171674 RepID=A0A952FJ79_9PROT|nr:MFS transporter [Inquilinus limosus]
MTSGTLDQRSDADGTVFAILAAISFSHLLNDMMQSLLPALYPMLATSFKLDFGQVGLITLVFNLTASILQPAIGLYTDRKPQPYSLPLGMGFTLVGLIVLSVAMSFPMLLLGAALVGMGSAVFHPESSRIARLASGGRHGLAQSVFQVGGNIGSAIGPLLAAFIVLPRGQASIGWFSAAALLAILVLTEVGSWYQRHRRSLAAKPRRPVVPVALSRGKIGMSLGILGMLVFSKYIYLASLTSYFTFYLIQTFGVSVQQAQVHLFIFLGAVAVGTVAGGPIGDRFGRKYVIWGSILGVLPFTMAMPYVGLTGTVILSIIIGLILASAFSAIVVYAQELVPGKTGTIAGLFFGFAFGMGGIGAAVLGEVADLTSIGFVYRLCAFLPLIGLLTVFLPDLERPRRVAAVPAE